MGEVSATLEVTRAEKQAVTSKGILQIQAISRHCDRLPVSELNIPNDPIDFEKISKLKLGELTGLGQYQCNQMGNNLYNRYISEQSLNRVRGISTQYVSSDYSFRSTDLDRTLMSMWSVSMGLFKQGTGNTPIVNFMNVNDLEGNSMFSLPNGTQAVPVHTVPQESDSVLIGYQFCNSVMKRMHAVNTQSAIEYFNKNRQLINELFKVTGWDASKGDLSLATLVDVLTVQKSHNLLSLQWVHEHWDEICALRDGYLKLIYTYPVFGREGSSDLVTLMNYNVAQTKVKYYHYSAHDTTLQALAASLKLTADYPYLANQPGYGSFMVMELHEMSDGSKAVRFVHAKQFNDTSFTPLTMTSLGCKSEYCPLEQFSELVSEYSMVPSDSTWCMECKNSNRDLCASEFIQTYQESNKALMITTPILAFTNLCTIFIMIAVIACCIRKNRKLANQQQDAMYHGMK
ncbi:predicted protein [Naegleria gruberi]|uniref:Predicted protein n=1 Tax=Naegleria gruberi TaxID=5762 RepID=D2VF27_NAEGR|nr:uncharacterized protein NAEGRDRAFT_49017 [Naegleria gruberi]EFC44610.1 predicted protein [Naegleria gruberi]|eukprot:XP_002677354.1 predicted protein [Naegleria gruberi strain NEG-M]